MYHGEMGLNGKLHMAFFSFCTNHFWHNDVFFSKCRVSVDFKNIGIKYAKNSGKNERKKRSFFDRSQDMPENPIKIGTYPTNYYAR